ncbi:MAG: tetratricopeptide repeat protein [Planctomycetota bacterium]|nr:tetratricopeptide repeat protein [Planctomycetota bacterium]
MKKKLNIKFVGILAVACVVALGTIKYVHDFQVGRQAGRLAEQADKSRAEGDLEQTVESLQRYLAYRPLDAKRRTELAKTYIELLEGSEVPSRAERKSAVQFIERALPTDQDNPELHWAAGKLFMKFFRVDDAMTHLLKVEAAYAANPELNLGNDKLGDVQLAIAQSYVGNEDRDQAVDYLKKTLGYTAAVEEYDPANTPASATSSAFALLAALLDSHLQDSRSALLVIDHMVAARPQDYKSHLTRAQYLSSQGEPEKYDTQIELDVAKAEELAPDETEVVIVTAEFALNHGNHERAFAILEKGRQKFPDDRRIYALQANAARMTGDMPAAIQFINDGLSRLVNDVELLVTRAELQALHRDGPGLDATIAKLKERVRPELLEFFQAERHFIQGEYAMVADILKRVRSVLPVRFENRASFLEVTVASASNHEAPEISNSTGLDVKYQYAVNLENSGQAEQALAMFQAILAEVAKSQRITKENREKFAVDIRTHILQNQIVLQRRLPESERKWDEVVAMTKEILKSDVLPPVRKDALQLSILVNAGEKAKSQKFAEVCLKRHPDDLSIWIVVLQTKEDFASANQFVDEMEAKFKDSVALRLRRAGIIGRFRPADAIERLQALDRNTDQFPPDQVASLQYVIGTQFAICGDVPQAYEMWKRVAASRPADMDLRMRLLRYYLERDMPTEVDVWTQEISKLTSAQSDESKYITALKAVMAAHRLNSKNEPFNAEELAKAKEMVTEVLRERPKWEDMLKIAADIELLTGNLPRATELLKQLAAVRPGDSSVTVPLVQLLVRNKQFTEAAVVLGQLGEAALTPDLLKMKVGVLEELGRFEDALSSMQQLVKLSPDDPKLEYFTGRLLSRAKDYPKAEAAFRSSLKRDPKNGEAWEELVRVFVLQDRKVEAENVLLESQLQLQNDPTLAKYVKARGSVILGDTEAADQAYRELAVSRPKDLSVLQLAATHFLKTNRPNVARGYTDRMLREKEASPFSEWARRTNAEILANNGLGRYADFLNAVELLQTNSPDGQLKGEDLQVYLKLAANRSDTVHQAKALELIRGEEKSRQLTEVEQFAKAKLLLARNDWDGYKESMTKILTVGTPNAEYLHHWITNLLNRNELALARQWFTNYPVGTPGHVPIELELLARERRTNDLLSKVQTLTPPDAKLREGNNVNIVLQLAGILEATSKYDPSLLQSAEGLLKKVAGLQQDYQLELISFHGRQFDKLELAFQECEALLEKADEGIAAKIGQVVVRSLRAHGEKLTPDSAPIKRGAEMFAKIKQAMPESADVQLLEAEMAEVQHQSDVALSIYQSLEKQSGLSDVVRAQVLNNLAYRLYLAGKGQESMPYIDEAIQLLGNRPDLLDTRAVIHLELGRVDAAVADLRTATELSDMPLIWLHLAQAELRAGHQELAVKAFVASRELGLQPDSLDSVDRKVYDAVYAELETQLPPATAATNQQTSAG